MQYYLALLLGSQFNIGSLYLAFSVYVFVLRLTSRKKQRLTLIQVQFLIILMIGMILSFVYVIYNESAYQDLDTILLSNRKYLIEIIFAVTLYEFLRYESMQYIIRMLFIAIIINAIVGTLQFTTNFPERISMLFPEPSAAGYFYLFVFFILLSKMSRPHYYNIVSKYFMILGIAIGSKAQIILLFIVGVLKYFAPIKVLSYILVVIAIFYVFGDDIMSIKAVKYNMKVLNLYLDKGLAGLRIDYGVWETYVTRISALQGALQCIWENPLGIGFGGYNTWFPDNMAHAGFSSPETDKIIKGTYYASTKSNLLEFFVSTGVFGISLYIYWFRQFFIIRKEHKYLVQSFIILTLASTFIELNPMYVYFMFLFILKAKETQLDDDMKEKI